MTGRLEGAIQRKVLQVSASGQIIAPVAGKKIRVVALFANAAGTVNANFQSGGVSPTTSLTGAMYMVANSGAVLPFNELGWFDTNAGEGLFMELSAGVAIGGIIQYVLVP